LCIRYADGHSIGGGVQRDVSTMRAFGDAVSSVRRWMADGATQDQATLPSTMQPLEAANEAAAAAGSRSHLWHDFEVADWRWACAAALFSGTSFWSDDGTVGRVGNLSSESLALRLIKACGLEWDISSRLLSKEPPPVLRYAGDINERGEPHGRGTANVYDSRDSGAPVIMRVSGEWSDGLPQGHVRCWFAPPASLRYFEGPCEGGHPFLERGIVALFRDGAYAHMQDIQSVAFRTALYAGTRQIEGGSKGVIVRRDGTRFFSGRISLLGEPLSGTFYDRRGTPVYKGHYNNLSTTPTFENDFEIYGYHGTVMRPADFDAVDDQDYGGDDDDDDDDYGDEMLYMDPVWLIFPNGDRARCLVDTRNALPDALIVRSFTFSALAEGNLAGLTIHDRYSWHVNQPSASELDETVSAHPSADRAEHRDEARPGARVLVLDDDAAEEDCFSSSVWKVRQTTALTFRPRGHRLEAAFCQHMARHYGPRWAPPPVDK
jgi:hypothetical protein